MEDISRDIRPTWVLVAESARSLTTRGISPFALRLLIAEVQGMDPGRDRTSIQPVVQGMTLNAGQGPPSPCGKILVRVAHGMYALVDGYEPIAGTEFRSSLRAPVSPVRRADRSFLDERVRQLIVDFDRLVEEFDVRVPFTRVGQAEGHRATIDARRRLGSVDAALDSDGFVRLLYRTLETWGIGRRGSRLVPLRTFHARLREAGPRLCDLEDKFIEDGHLEVAAVSADLYDLVQNLGVVENDARIVAGTKTLHHLLPDLVPPMDRAYTGAFFGWLQLDPQYNQRRIFTTAFTTFVEVARASTPSRLIGVGWRTSATKIIDNAIVAYCLRYLV